MSGSKIVILVLVLVAVTFTVMVAVSSWPGRATKFDKNSGWVKALKNAFPPKALDQKRIDSACFKEGAFTIPPNQSGCKAHIRERKGRASIRNLTLELRTGQGQLSYEPNTLDENALPVENRKLKPGESITLQILEHGGTLTFTKSGSPLQPCRIEVKE